MIRYENFNAFPPILGPLPIPRPRPFPFPFPIEW